MPEEGNKHYIRIDNHNRVIAGFSDAFKQPQDTDICINEQAGRQFELFGKINPPLKNDEGIPLYKYENREVKERTLTEIQNDINNLPPKPKSQLQILQEIVEQLIINSLS